MRAAGLESTMIARLVCPIGLEGIAGKEPAVIAISIAAQLLIAFEARHGLERIAAGRVCA